MTLISMFMILASVGNAQEYAVTVGAARTDALTQNLGAAGPVSVDGQLNWRLGGHFAYAFAPAWRVRTGLEYVRRHFAWNRGLNEVSKIDLEYLDVPLNAQYDILPMLGVFGGFKAAFMVNDRVRDPGQYHFDLAAESMIWFFDLGVSYRLRDHFIVEAFYERNFGGQLAYALSEFSEGGLRLGYQF